MGVPESERRAAAGWTTTELTLKVDVANSNCTQWKNEVTRLEEERDLGVLDYIPVVWGYKAVTGSDELNTAKQHRDDWCDRLAFYSAELQKRRKAAPVETAAAVDAAYRERTAQREEVRERAARGAKELESRTEFGGSETMIGGAVRSVTDIPGQIKEGFFGTIGLGQDQTVSERAVGFGRLSLAILLAVAAYAVGGKLLGAGAAFAERGAERSAKLTEQLMDKPLPPGVEF
jgi:hypothetical protein